MAILVLGLTGPDLVAQSVVPIAAPKRVMRDLPVWHLDTRMLRQQVVDEAAGALIETPRVIHAPAFSGPANDLEAGGLLSEWRSVPSNQWFGIAGITGTGWYPPDPDIAVGPDHVLEVVNSSVAWFRKSDGVREFQQTSGTFFAGLAQSTFIFDPKAFYDPYNGRYAILFLERDTATQQSHLLMAVSDDTDPNGAWYRYRIDAAVSVNGTRYWIDYPGFGYTRNAYLVSGNMFSFTSTGFGGAQVISIPAAPLVAGGAASYASFFPAGGSSIQVAEMANAPGSTAYAASRAGGTSLRVYAIAGADTLSPTLTGSLVTVPSHSGPTSDAASTNGRWLDTIDGRLFNVAWRSGRLVTAHNSTPASGQPVASRWYEINTGNWPVSGAPTLVQAGLVSSPNLHYFDPAINVNTFGDIGMIFTASSSSVTADLMTTSRKASDPLGFMGLPTLMRHSDGDDYGYGRWGDYYGVDVDPTDDTTFWGVGQIVSSSNFWNTEIVTWTLAHGPPTAASQLRATAVSSSRIELAWNDAEEESVYVLERSLDGATFDEYRTLTANTVSYADTGLAASTTYWYRLRSENELGSATSGIASATTNSPPSYVDTFADVDMLISGSLVGTYQDTWAEDGIVESIGETQSGGRPSRRHSLLQHQWRFSNVAGGLGITLFVTASAEANAEGDDFEFQASNDGGATWTTVLTVVNGTPAGTSHVGELPFSTAGTYDVQVVDTDRTPGNNVLDSIQVDRLFLRTDIDPTDTPPNAPTNVTANAVAPGIVLVGWSDGSQNERGFKILRSSDGVVYDVLAAAGANETSYYDTAAAPNTRYWYEVVAFTASYETPSGSPAAVTTPDGITLSAEGTKQKGAIVVNLRWEGGSSLASVAIERSDNGGPFETIATVARADGAYLDQTGLKGGHTLQYKVCNPTDPSFCSNVVTLVF